MKPDSTWARLQIAVLLLIAVLILVVGLTVPAAAQTQDSQAGHASNSVPAPSPTTINLSPIVVTGHKLYLPVVLQMIKAALKRPVNFRHENLDKLVCQFTRITPAHPFQTLDCRTNCQRWIRSMANQGVGVSTRLCASGGRAPPVASPGELVATVAGWANRQRINPGALRRLLKKLPPADSS